MYVPRVRCNPVDGQVSHGDLASNHHEERSKEETVKNTSVIDYFSKLIGAKSTKLPKAAVNAVKERGIYKDQSSDMESAEEESQSASESEQQDD